MVGTLREVLAEASTCTSSMRAPHASLWWATLPRAASRSRRRSRRSRRRRRDRRSGLHRAVDRARPVQRTDPSLRVVVLDADVAGAGASGRNGGWASALYPISFGRVERDTAAPRMHLLLSTLREAVVALAERGARSDGIDVRLPPWRHRHARQRRPRQVDPTASASSTSARLDGTGDDDLRWLEADEALARCGATGGARRDSSRRTAPPFIPPSSPSGLADAA